MWLYSDQWAAGFFDGEGCLTIELRSNRDPGALVVQVTQKMRAPLDELQRRWMGKVSLAKAGCYRWRVAARRADAFLRAVYPHCLVKREQIELGFEYLSTMGTVGQRTNPATMATRLRLIQEISDAKRNWGP
jgi:hypothetical protein